MTDFNSSLTGQQIEDILTALTFDANGNLLAHITPRKDTLVNLMAVSDAGDGEVATASDQDAQVIYKGDPISIGECHFRNDVFAKINVAITSGFVIPPGAGYTQLSFLSINADNLDIVDLVNDKIITPTVLDFAGTAKGILFDVSFSASLFSGDAKNFTFAIDTWNGSAWVNQWKTSFDRQVFGIVAAVHSFAISNIFLAAAVSGQDIRVSMLHDGTNNVQLFAGQVALLLKIIDGTDVLQP